MSFSFMIAPRQIAPCTASHIAGGLSCPSQIVANASRHRFCGGIAVRPGTSRPLLAAAVQPREINAPEQCGMPGGAAVRGPTDESGRAVPTVSGISIAKFAETQRSQRRHWPQ